MASTIFVPPSRCTSCCALRSAPEALENGCPSTLDAMSTPGTAVVLMTTLPLRATVVPGAGPLVPLDVALTPGLALFVAERAPAPAAAPVPGLAVPLGAAPLEACGEEAEEPPFMDIAAAASASEPEGVTVWMADLMGISWPSLI